MLANVADIQAAYHMPREDLYRIQAWAHPPKMIINHDVSKHAVEVVFSVKRSTGLHPELSVNDFPISRLDNTKDLGLIPDSRLTNVKHIHKVHSQSLEMYQNTQISPKTFNRQALNVP